MSKMIDILKPSDIKKSDFKYKRLFVTKWFPCGDDEDDLRQKVNIALNEIKKFESNMADKM